MSATKSHRWPPESYNKLPEEGYEEGFSELVSDFTEASGNFTIFFILSTKGSCIVKTITGSAHTRIMY